MSPIRHEDDFRRREIDDWDEYVQEQLEESIAKGEFENLPDKGKPIKIWRTELNPEYDLAFSRLKNAGVLPAWMELDAEVARLTQENEDFLERSRTFLLDQLELFREQQEESAVRGDDRLDDHLPWQLPRWNVWRRVAAWWRLDPSRKDDPPPVSITDLVVQRERMRSQYLDRAAALDKKIADYHNALPRELSHLQRLRMLPERAARLFDERIPARLIVEPTDPAAQESPPAP
jgi:hypothetical protein